MIARFSKIARAEQECVFLACRTDRQGIPPESCFHVDPEHISHLNAPSSDEAPVSRLRLSEQRGLRAGGGVAFDLSLRIDSSPIPGSRNGDPRLPNARRQIP